MNGLPRSSKPCRLVGFTLLEVTLVISILLALTSVLFLGTHVYLRGADRAICLQHISHVQKAVRCYSNLIGMESGSPIGNFKDEIFGHEKLIPVEPVCPSGGTYLFHEGSLPHVGDLYMECSIPDHTPKNHATW
ncbi:MAG: type II secretion system protein [Verrucomicrobiae bacterium]|nr:type II secretion system protein [Verrucomicrobiae bacterium]